MLSRDHMTGDEARHFEWTIPARYNMGVDVCDKWVARDPDRIALIDEAPDGTTRQMTFAALQEQSNRLANGLLGLGLGPGDEVGDRIGIMLPQSLEAAVSHVTTARMGCVSIPLSTLFGPDALVHRLHDSGARAVIADAAGCTMLAGLRDRLPDLEALICTGPLPAGMDLNAVTFDALCAGSSPAFTPRDTASDEPVMLVYTSGTTGHPKGALHAHRFLLGHLPGIEASHNFLPAPGDCFWTPADWAWIGGLMDVLMPGLHHGIPVVACRFHKFTAEAAIALIRAHKIRNVFLPPTAIKIMRQYPGMASAGLKLRSVASGGETVGAELLRWGQEAFGTTINEFYGQTECNAVISSCTAIEAPTPGAMGRAAPGHKVEIVDPATGQILPAGTEGAIAVEAPDPVMFLRYWNAPEATAAKFVDGPEGRYLLTGDRGSRDAEGRFRFLGRDDDVISSAGYRIGPAEVEDCLLTHPAVRMAGVVGKPDPLRGHVVAAYLTLNDGYAPSDELASGIAAHVGTQLAAYEYPRVVRFLAELPMTTTGKIIRGKLRALAEAEAARDAAAATPESCTT